MNLMKNTPSVTREDYVAYIQDLATFTYGKIEEEFPHEEYNLELGLISFTSGQSTKATLVQALVNYTSTIFVFDEVTRKVTLTPEEKQPGLKVTKDKKVFASYVLSSTSGFYTKVGVNKEKSRMEAFSAKELADVLLQSEKGLMFKRSLEELNKKGAETVTYAQQLIAEAVNSWKYDVSIVMMSDDAFVYVYSDLPRNVKCSISERQITLSSKTQYTFKHSRMSTLGDIWLLSVISDDDKYHVSKVIEVKLVKDIVLHRPNGPDILVSSIGSCLM